jgi:hypothetical protein
MSATTSARVVTAGDAQPSSEQLGAAPQSRGRQVGSRAPPPTYAASTSPAPPWLASLMATHGIRLNAATIQALALHSVTEKVFTALTRKDLAELGLTEFAPRKSVMMLVEAVAKQAQGDASAAASGPSTPAWLAALMAQHDIQLDAATVQALIDKNGIDDAEIFVDLTEQEQDRLQDLSVGGLKKVKRLVAAAKSLRPLAAAVAASSPTTTAAAAPKVNPWGKGNSAEALRAAISGSSTTTTATAAAAPAATPAQPAAPKVNPWGKGNSADVLRAAGPAAAAVAVVTSTAEDGKAAAATVTVAAAAAPAATPAQPAAPKVNPWGKGNSADALRAAGPVVIPGPAAAVVVVAAPSAKDGKAAAAATGTGAAPASPAAAGAAGAAAAGATGAAGAAGAAPAREREVIHYDLYVRNLPENTTEDELYEALKGFGIARRPMKVEHAPSQRDDSIRYFAFCVFEESERGNCDARVEEIRQARVRLRNQTVTADRARDKAAFQ